MTGDVRLIDSESGEGFEVTVSAYTLAEYKKGFDAFCAELSAMTRQYGVDYVRITTDVPFEELVLRYLTAGGLLR